MNISMFFLHLLLNVNTSATDAILTQNTSDGLNAIIGIGGIFATIIVGLITCFVTWKLTMKSIEQKKLSYSKQTINIFSNSIKRQQSALNNLSIKYGNKELNNPCLLLVEIENTGNKSISNPPIMVSSDIEMIPGGFQDVPDGYESIWSMRSLNSNCCSLNLEHINPKQIAKVYFILDGTPNNVSFTCPMQDIVIHERTTESSTVYNNKNKLNFKKSQKITLSLLVTFVLLLSSFNIWTELLYLLENKYIFLPSPIEATIFIFSILIISVMLNVFGIKKIDNFILNHKSISWIIKLFLFLTSILLLCLIIFDIFFVNYFMQVFVAMIVIIMLSVLIHIFSIDNY